MIISFVMIFILLKKIISKVIYSLVVCMCFNNVSFQNISRYLNYFEFHLKIGYISCLASK